MPYTLFQGGRHRRRPRRLIAVLLVALLAVTGVAAALRDPAPERTPPPAVTPVAPLDEEPGVPLEGGGTAPTELGVRLNDPRDAVSVRFKRPPRPGCSSTSTRAACSGAGTRRGPCRSRR
jgi:hypothetical protein